MTTCALAAAALLVCGLACQLAAPLPVPSAAGTGGAAAGFAEWPMPNPPSETDLPRTRSYDTSDPDVAVDLVTGLRWRRGMLSDTLTWSDAVGACATTFGESWRLPMRIELVSLIGVHDDNLDKQAFPGAPWRPIWSASVSAIDGQEAWCLDLSDGLTIRKAKTEHLGVLCVNGARTSIPPGARYETSSGPPDTIYDTRTSLTWQRTIPAEGVTWGDGEVRCYAMGSSWRLPSLTELQTIVDETRAAPAIDPTTFRGAPAAPVWTGTLEDNVPTQAHFVDLTSGETNWTNTFNKLAAVCVR